MRYHKMLPNRLISHPDGLVSIETARPLHDDPFPPKHTYLRNLVPGVRMFSVPQLLFNASKEPIQQAEEDVNVDSIDNTIMVTLDASAEGDQRGTENMPTDEEKSKGEEKKTSGKYDEPGYTDKASSPPRKG